MAYTEKSEMGGAVRLPDGVTLMTNGAAAFAEILQCIREARHAIEINMFIWRDDVIGNEMARAVLAAADRGVHVRISADRYSVPLEYAEESGRSMFHKKRTIFERLETAVLSALYPGLKSESCAGNDGTALYEQMLGHPLIEVEKDVVKADHSKYYIFDEQTVILGGVNIEDKENGRDARGIVYQDYMIELRGRDYVDAFREKLAGGTGSLPDLRFTANRKTPERSFEIEKEYLRLIKESRHTLTIVMAYFAPIKPFMAAITAAAERGVDVRVMISEAANYQDSKNKQAVKTLMRNSSGKVKVYFSPMMLHTKLVISDDAVCVGSCNITRNSLYKMGELNIMTRKAPLVDAIKADVEKNIALARQCRDDAEIRYNPIQAWLESRFS